MDAAVDRGVMRLEDSALARAIEGEERMVVSGGKLMGFERRHNDQLVMFFLRNRRVERYVPDWRSIRPRHPLYEKVSEDVVAEMRANEPDIEDVRAEILRKIEAMERARGREAEDPPRHGEMAGCEAG